MSDPLEKAGPAPGSAPAVTQQGSSPTPVEPRDAGDESDGAQASSYSASTGDTYSPAAPRHGLQSSRLLTTDPPAAHVPPVRRVSAGTRRDPIRISRPDGARWSFPPRREVTHEFIDELVAAVIAQDKAEYPGKNPAVGIRSGRGKLGRVYSFDGRMLTLSQIMSLERTASGVRAEDTKALPYATIAERWRIRQFEKTPYMPDEDAPVASIRNPIILRRADGGRFEMPPHGKVDIPFIRSVLGAILVADTVTYPPPHRRGSFASTAGRFHGRFYLLGENDPTIVSLGVISGWERVALGKGPRDFKAISEREMIERWNTDLFPADIDPAEKLGSKRNPIRLPLRDIPRRKTKAYIDKVVAAILEADPEKYPEPNPALSLSTTEDKRHRYYQIGNRVVSLNTVMGWERKASGIAALAHDKLPYSEIVIRWRKRQIALRPLAADNGLPVASQKNPVVLTDEAGAELTMPSRVTSEFIDRLLLAVLRNDKHYGSVSRYSWIRSNHDKLRRVYYFDGKLVTLERIIGWERKLHGLNADDYKEMSHAKVAALWRERLRSSVTAARQKPPDTPPPADGPPDLTPRQQREVFASLSSDYAGFKRMLDGRAQRGFDRRIDRIREMMENHSAGEVITGALLDLKADLERACPFSGGRNPFSILFSRRVPPGAAAHPAAAVRRSAPARTSSRGRRGHPRMRPAARTRRAALIPSPAGLHSLSAMRFTGANPILSPMVRGIVF